MDLLALIKQALEALQIQVAQLEADIPVKEKAAYDKGFADGAAAAGIDKIYSQAEFDAKLAEALAPIQAELDGVKAELAAVKESLAKDEQKIESAKADLA